MENIKISQNSLKTLSKLSQNSLKTLSKLSQNSLKTLSKLSQNSPSPPFFEEAVQDLLIVSE